MPTKPKTTQIATPDTVQRRDLFGTPRYAIQLLQPFIPGEIDSIWECAGNNSRITKILKEYGYNVIETDLQTGSNFLACDMPESLKRRQDVAIVTNPPFSLKKSFYNRCKYWQVKFALLIPTDYSKWIIDAIRYDGCEKIIPDSRINYLTPNILDTINSKEKTNFESIELVSDEIIYKYTSSQFHSMWLTWGFDLEQSETFVELSNTNKKGNIL